VIARWLVATLLLAACGGSGPGTAGVASHTPGPVADTWLRQGSAWRQVAGPHPSPRYAAAMAYDAARRDFVLFGGQFGGVTYDETWTFDGKAWKLQTPVHKPPPRRGAAMAYDPSLRLVVLYGGLVPDGSEGSEADDTWTWDGAGWALVTGNISGPSYRNGAEMVTAGDRVILFGGHTSNTKYYGDAWTLAGSSWVRIDHGPNPAGRGEAAVAWNADDSSLVVYGGIGIRPNAGPGNLGLPLTDAWSLKGGTWSQLSASGPPALYNASAVWDAATHSVVVMFGMECPNPVSDEWSWNGSAWKRSSLPVPARWSAAVAADSSGDVLVFGGDDESGC
jgi:hypothetical protein